MDQSETLLTVAELSVALAGFAGLVSVIGRDRDRQSSIADGLRLQMMLEVALLNAALALFPLPFLQPATFEPEIWRLGSGIHFVSSVGLVLFGFYRYRTTRPDPDPLWSSSSMIGLAVVTSVLDVFNAVGLGGSSAFSFYLATLLLSLVGAGVKFMVVARSVFTERGD